MKKFIICLFVLFLGASISYSQPNFNTNNFNTSVTLKWSAVEKFSDNTYIPSFSWFGIKIFSETIKYNIYRADNEFLDNPIKLNSKPITTRNPIIVFTDKSLSPGVILTDPTKRVYYYYIVSYINESFPTISNIIGIEFTPDSNIEGITTND